MNNEKQSSSSAFVQYVINRCSNEKDTGFRAVMRRADNPNQCSAAWEYLVPFCDLASAHQRLSFALIGAAIAREKPEHDGTNGVGEALLKLCNGDKDAKKREGTRNFNSIFLLTYIFKYYFWFQSGFSNFAGGRCWMRRAVCRSWLYRSVVSSDT